MKNQKVIVSLTAGLMFYSLNFTPYSFCGANEEKASSIAFEKSTINGDKLVINERRLGKGEFEKYFDSDHKNQDGDKGMKFRIPDSAVKYNVLHKYLKGEDTVIDSFVSYRSSSSIINADLKIIDASYDKKNHSLFIVFEQYTLFFIRKFDVQAKKLEFSYSFYKGLSGRPIVGGKIIDYDGNKLKVILKDVKGEELFFKKNTAGLLEEYLVPDVLSVKQTLSTIKVGTEKAIIEENERSPYDEQTIWSREIVDSPIMGVGPFVSRQRIRREPTEDALHDLLPGEELPPTKVIDRYIWKTGTWSDVDGWIIPELWVQEVEFDEKNPVKIEVLDMNYKLGSPVLSTVYKKAGRFYANVIWTDAQGQPVKMAEKDMLLPLSADELNVTSALLEGSIESPKVVLNYVGEKKITFFFREGKWARVTL